MRVFAGALALWATGVANARNSCFDPEYAFYGCEPGTTYIDLDNCNIGDEDLEDLRECFDNIGRASVTSIMMNYNSLTELPGGGNGTFVGFDNLKTLGLESAGIKTLYADSFEGLGGSLASIYMYGNRLTTIPVGCFDNLVGLYRLVLYYNDLAWIPAGAFRGLGGLRQLYLSNNALSTLPAGLFDGLGELTDLDLSDNEDLQCIPSLAGSPNYSAEEWYLPEGFGDGGTCSCPSAGDDGACASNESCSPGTDGYICSIVRNSCLDPENDLYACEAGSTEIKLSNCGIGGEDLEDLVECFDNVGRASVTAIWLGSNSFTTLSAGLFDGFDNVESLSLGNLLTTLPLGLFDGLDSLSYLYLGGNQFTSLPAGVFDGLESLLKIFLQDNPLTSLPAGLFNGLDALETIYQPDNQLTSLPAGLFGDLKSLQGISLQNNQLASLPAGLFDGLDELQYLALYSNQLASLPAGLFDGLGALETLSLNVNQLTSLPAGLFDDLDALEDLNLGVNQLASLPAGLFDGLHALQYLSLQWNDGLQCLPSLFGLGLVNGAELFLPDGFESGGECDCPSSGDACGSGESCSPGTDGYICTVVPNSCLDPENSLYGCEAGNTQIYLDYCGIGDEDLEDLAKCFDNAGRASVTVIEVHNNELTSLPVGLFDGLDTLSLLSLHANQFTSLPAGLFDGLDRLQILHLLGNSLTTLPSGLFDGLHALRVLSLSDNALVALPAGIFNDLGALQALYLQQNSLSMLRVGVFDDLKSLTQLRLEDNDDLQCLPSLTGSPLLADDKLFLPDGFEDGGICSCPSLGDHGVCESDESCTPGTDGYACSTVRNSCFDPDYDLYGCEPGSTQIDLDNCGIGDEDLEDLKECFDNVGRASVTTISMNSNGLTELPGGENGIFAGFDSLKTLMLNQNNIETLYAESFEGLGGALTSLSIIQSRLTTIPVGCFDNLVGLQTMTLYGNDLAWLPVGAFRGLGELGTLSLAGNALSTLPAGLFDGMEGLTVLNLSENEDLQCVPSMAGSPNYSASEWSLPEGFGDGGMCSCPSSGDHGACESDESCSPGTDGYICSTGQSDIPSYLGCFSDPAENRVFEWKTSTAGMTAEVCSELCSNSAFYGTQYSTECWCGDNVGYADNGPGVCDMPCSGDSDEICGGSYALSIYSNEPNYLGCYSDPADNRIFELVASSVDMTAEVCLAHCGKHQYYGTQYSIECWCGDNADYDANGAGDCDTSCSGDSSEVCGGSYSMSVYKNFDVDTAAQPYHLGCYADPADNRVFVQNESSDAMTAELCASQCAGSAFYGTQYSTECWCGDINAPYSVNGEGVCDMTCSGNPEEPCGGSYSINVYAHDPSYLGCFSDPADGRLFVRESSTSAMTAKACATLCAGSAYYGTQYSQECWCGDNADYDASGFGVCNMSCSGNSDEMCGGSYTMSVYQNI